MKFGENLYNLRKGAKMSQEKLAEKMNVSRQSVSKWETGESYPEMDKILKLCDIFHCKINSLVHENIVDLDSLDEEIKMNVVKFKEEKQKKVKGLSKALSVIGQIGGIVAKIGIVVFIMLFVLVPILLSKVEVKDNKVYFENDEIVYLIYGTGEKNTNVDIKLNDGSDELSVKEMEEIITSAIQRYSKLGFNLLLELGFASMIGFIFLINLLFKHLKLLFDNIYNGDTPFTLDNVTHIKKMSYIMIACIVVSVIGSFIMNIAFIRESTFEFKTFDIIEILFLLVISYIFEYGYEIQLDSNGKIYGKDEIEK